MKQIPSYQSVYKLFFVLLLLSLIFSSFDGKGVSFALAQEGNSETPAPISERHKNSIPASQQSNADVRVSISAEKTYFSESEDVLLQVTLTNTSNDQIKILRWYTPIEGVTEPLFVVTRGGEKSNYHGPLVSHLTPVGEYYITLQAGESITSEVNLSLIYDFPVSGNYTVVYDVFSPELYFGELDNGGSLTSNVLGLFVEGRDFQFKGEVTSQNVIQDVSGSTSYSFCDTSQQLQLSGARNNASTYANLAWDYMLGGSTGLRYTTWFGSYTASRYNTVHSNINSIRSAVDSASLTFNCSAVLPCKSDIIAYVYDFLPYTIYTCSGYWTLPDTGIISKADTIIHEISHFDIVANTDDHAYGIGASRDLADNDPSKAIANADNYKFFAVNPAELECQSMGVPSVVSPVNDQSINDNTPYIDWTDVTNNDGYQFQLYNSDFSTKIVDSFAPSFYYAPTLSEGTYYWRAMAYTASAGCVDGEWSTFWAFSIDMANPSVTVTAPNGGESWHAGTSHNITWSASDNVGVSYVALDYSTNGGSTWTSIDSNDPNDGTFSWTMPNAPTSSARVRVTAYDTAGNSGFDISNANFTITAPSDTTNPSVTVTIPNGGESWQAGTSHNITWSASDNVGVSYVALDYSTNGGSTWTSIDSNDPNDGTFSWTVPNAPTSSARVRVTAYDTAGNSGFDISNANFTITPPSDTTNPSVTVTIPNGGESWQAGTSHNITWSASDNVGVSYVALDYSTNGGSTWTSIDSNDPNDGSFSWTVPNAPTSSARVRVTAYDTAGNAGFDISNANFTITPPAVPSGIHINEIDLNGRVSVELYNPTAQAVDISGWYLLFLNNAATAGQAYEIPSSVSIPAGGYIVVQADTGINTSTTLYTGVITDWSSGYTGGWAAIMTTTAGVDFVRWGDSTDTPPTATNWTGINPLNPTSGLDLGRNASSTDTDDGSDWCSQTPTLGGQNGGCNAPPAAFYKIGPSNSLTPLQSVNITLSWESTSPLTRFEYCIDTTDDSNCSNWTGNGLNTSVSPSNLQFDTTYYWHVRAYNGSAGPTYSNGSSTSFWTFKTQSFQQTPQKISAGGWHTCAVTANGSIMCWGDNDYGQLNIPAPNSNFKEVSAAYSHSCGLKTDGSIVCWGRNSLGELNVPAPNNNFIQVSAGSGNSCGVKNDGSIVCWGDSRYGRTSVPSPNSSFVQVSAADGYNCGLKADGSIACWGWSSPIPSPNSGFKQISAYEDLCGLKGDSSIGCAGYNTYGQMNIPAPNSGFTAVSSGLAHTCALKSDGSIACWGAVGGFNYGQTIVPSPNSNFIYVSSGNEHTCGMKNDSSIICWGHNGYNQANVPLILSGKPYVVSITRASTSPTNATTVNFTVTFSESVTGADTTMPYSDFSLSTAGVTGAMITGVSGSGLTRTVIVNTGLGSGTIRLNVIDDDSIKDGSNNPLGGVGLGNGNYTSGEVYAIIRNNGADTTGVFRPSNGLLYLKNRNDTGFADMALNYGLPGDYPVVGDWDGNGTVTIGIYRQGNFYLRNENTIGFAEIVFPFGVPGDQPIAGDWNGDGVDTIGVFHPSNAQFMLRNSNTEGPVEMTFYLGNAGDVGIAGDWDGDGLDTTGVFRPSNGLLYLKNKNETGFADAALNYGLPGDKPVTGDWDGDGIDTIGVYRNGLFYLRNSNTIGFAEIIFGLGNPSDMPIAGNWDGMP